MHECRCRAHRAFRTAALFAALGLFGMAQASRGAEADARPADPLSGDALFADVQAYSRLGEHRTGTPEDRKTSQWLAGELRRVGAEIKLHPIRLRQFVPTAVALEIDGQPVKSFPLWWPAPTGPTPVVGPLVTPGEKPGPGSLNGKIAFVKIDKVPGATLGRDSVVHRLIEPLVGAGVAGVVLMTVVPTGEYVALNAPVGLPAWPVPVLLVGKRDEAALDRAAVAGAKASLLLDGRYDDRAEALEVVGRINRGPRLIVVTTPSSGWFHCAGERGPGVALWLAMARWAAARQSDASFLFVASSGHELGGLGIKHFMDHLAPDRADVKCWVHLGAGIATYEYEATDQGPQKKSTASPLRRLYCGREFEPVLRDAFAGIPDLTPIATDRPDGELALIARRGYPCWGFAGDSEFHHQAGDLPEQITGPELLEPVARAVVKAIMSIEAGKK